MSVRIYLEIGHEATIRTKKTEKGFTHDWEVYVKGSNDAEIHYYVEKVVFYLHESFPKPKRVIKEPPYSVKESGYAGFNFPIDIYLRNNQEPKKIRFNYDLHLQDSGPTIHSVRKEKYVFNSPTDDFRDKLIKGGGKAGNLSSFQEINEVKSSQEDRNQLLNKPKLSGSDMIKKHKVKIDEPRNNTSFFQDLFGPPITTTRVSQDLKPGNKEGKNSLKTDKSNLKVIDKHSPHKDKEKSKDKLEVEKKSKDEKKSRDRMKERERSKEKNLKKDKSPLPKSPSPRRSSPRRSPSRLSSPLLQKPRESKHDKDKRDKCEEKKAKKEKRDKDHKENKHKDHIDDGKLLIDHKEQKNKVEYKSVKEMVKQKDENSTSPQQKALEGKDKIKEKSFMKDIKEVKADKSGSEEKKYKYKKKDKDKREKKEEKIHKSSKKIEKLISAAKEADKVMKEADKHLFDSPKNDIMKKEKPSNKLIKDESNSSNSSRDTSPIFDPVDQPDIKREICDNKNFKDDVDKSKKGEIFKKDKRNDKDYVKKSKRKTDVVDGDEPPEKIHREEILNNNLDTEDTESNIPARNQDEVEYMTVLRQLQHKIMTLKSNEDLQKVVQLIADTGKFEISDHTFDFDLCLLDRSTVRQLQDFFDNES